MSAVLVISLVAVVAVIALAYALVFQTLDNKRKQRQRVTSAMVQRAKIFEQMTRSFPDNFMPKDIVALIYRCLVDTFEQLIKLEPNNKKHAEAAVSYQDAMAKTQKLNDAQLITKLGDLQKIKEVRTQLQDLHKFVEKLLQKGSINTAQAKVYSKQIRDITVNISVEAYQMNANQALLENKTALAIHHNVLARKLLTKVNANNIYAVQLAEINTTLTELEAKLAEEETEKENTDADGETGENGGDNKEWNGFDDGGADWKKKTVYD